MNREIPLLLVKSNQVGVILIIILATVIREPFLLLVLWMIQAIGLAFGTRASLFIRIAQPFLHKKLEGTPTQSLQLQRFNNSLGMLFLTISLLCFCFQMNTTGYLFAFMFAAAALLSVCGFCVGCIIYYQYKQIKHKLTR